MKNIDRMHVFGEYDIQITLFGKEGFQINVPEDIKNVYIHKNTKKELVTFTI